MTLKRSSSIGASDSGSVGKNGSIERHAKGGVLSSSFTQSTAVWNKCVLLLQKEMSYQQYSTWIRPLQAAEDDQQLRLLAPNQYEWFV